MFSLYSWFEVIPALLRKRRWLQLLSATSLEVLHANLIVLFAENRQVVLFIRVLIFLHGAPVSNHSFPSSTPDMIAEMTAPVVALDACSLSRLAALIAIQVEALLIDHTFNLSPRIISEVYLRVPVHANHMCPKLRFLIDAFHDSINFIAKKAPNLSALQGPILEQHLAPLAIPVAGR